MKNYLLIFLIFTEIVSSISFINLFGSFRNVKAIGMFQMRDLHERKLYGSYLLGLRKTKRMLRNSTSSILNFTSNFTNDFAYYTSNNNTIINNTDVYVKNIIMGNVVIDVSNVKEIQIRTENNKIILELDKRPKGDTNMISMIGNINNIDTVINAANLFGYIMNIYRS